MNWKSKTISLLEMDPKAARLYLLAQEKIDALRPLLDNLEEGTDPQFVLSASEKIEALLQKEGGGVMDLLRKKYEEVQQILPNLAPKVKNILLTDVTDVESLGIGLQDISEVVKRNTDENAKEYKYTRKNTPSSELSELTKNIVYQAFNIFKKTVDHIEEKGSRLEYFFGLVQDEAVKYVNEVEPLLRPAFNQRIQQWARTVSSTDTFTASVKEEAINDMLLENVSGSVEGEAPLSPEGEKKESEVTEIKQNKTKFLVTSPKSKPRMKSTFTNLVSKLQCLECGKILPETARKCSKCGSEDIDLYVGGSK